MNIEFTATEASTIEELETVISGVASREDTSGNREYLTFQRGVTLCDSEDWGVYLEYNDQLNSCYGCVAQCEVTKGSLNVNLSKPIESLANVTGFKVKLEINDSEYANLLKGLSHIFSDQGEIYHASA
jgi:hypothetical protein